MNAFIKCLAAVSILTGGFVLYDKAHDAKGQDAKKVFGEAVPEPRAEHKWLAEGAGKWKAVGKIYQGPDKTIPMSGVQTNTMLKGGLWQLTDYVEDDGSFVGHRITGYDPDKKKFISVRVDNMSLGFTPGEGTLSADKKTLTLDYMATGKPGEKDVIMTETITRKDDKTVLFEMSAIGPNQGKPMKILEITYTKM